MTVLALGGFVSHRTHKEPRLRQLFAEIMIYQLCLVITHFDLFYSVRLN